VAAPSGIEGVHWSDHWSFWVAGYPAIMVTDTAPFRYPRHHTLADTPEKIDYTAMARVPAVWRKSSGRLLLASCAYLMDTGRNGSTLDRRSDLALLA
jgi:hypothetical protein